jgi:hypothetical protein
MYFILRQLIHKGGVIQKKWQQIVRSHPEVGTDSQGSQQEEVRTDSLVVDQTIWYMTCADERTQTSQQTVRTYLYLCKSVS